MVLILCGVSHLAGMNYERKCMAKLKIDHLTIYDTGMIVNVAQKWIFIYFLSNACQNAVSWMKS
jgi:hypothetical protein